MQVANLGSSIIPCKQSALVSCHQAVSLLGSGEAMGTGELLVSLQ